MTSPTAYYRHLSRHGITGMTDLIVLIHLAQSGLGWVRNQDLIYQTGVFPSTLSYRLKALREVGYLTTRRVGSTSNRGSHELQASLTPDGLSLLRAAKAAAKKDQISNLKSQIA